MKKKVRPHNYVNIFGWMVDLGLSSNELIVYALIFGFSQDEESEFQGSIAYIQEWIGANSKHTAINTLKKLEDKGLIKKEQYSVNGVTFNKFKHVIPDGVEVVQPLHRGSAKNAQEVVQEMHYGGSAKNAPNINNSINSRITPINTENNNINKEINNTTSPSIPQWDECEEMSKEKILFEEFRKIYLGTKRGLDVEFANFCKKHKDWREVLPYLKVNYERQIEAKKSQRGSIDPRYEKHLQTYINNRCWEEEISYGSNSINTQSAHGTQRESLQEWADRQPKLVY
jgi:hypothetical protein